MLCHADLRSEEDRAAAQAAAAEVAARTAAADQVAARGRHRRAGAPQPAAGLVALHPDPAIAEAAEVETAPPVSSLAEVDVEAMLQQLAAEQPNPLGSVSGQLSDRTTKIVLVLGGAGVMTVLTLVGLLVLGSLFG
ncbi:MAG: hypothetical protein MUC45_06980 [Actinomycetia bacterium]|jgi:hypothetical protein|nr:hypothetical protein [Actinomycetes bacterium]